MYQDAHLHFMDNHELFLRSAQERGITRLFWNTTTPREWPALLDIARDHSAVLPFFGIHPWYVEHTQKSSLSELEHYLSLVPSGIGEIGLDKAFQDTPLEKQRDIFGKQLAIAYQHKRPFTLHCVRAWGTCIDMLRSTGWDGSVPFIAHAFYGSEEIMKTILDLGAYLSFSLKELRRFVPKAVELLQLVPLDRLLLESDYPFVLPGEGELPPEAYRDSMQELYTFAAESKKIPLPELLTALYENGTVIQQAAVIVP